MLSSEIGKEFGMFLEKKAGMAGTQGATGKRRAKGRQGPDNLGPCR